MHIEYMKVLRNTETFNALKAIDVLSKAPVSVLLQCPAQSLARSYDGYEDYGLLFRYRHRLCLYFHNRTIYLRSWLSKKYTQAC